MIVFKGIKEKICRLSRNKPYCYSLIFEIPEKIYDENGNFIEEIQQEQIMDFYFKNDLDINIINELASDCEESLEKLEEIKNLYKES